VSETAAAMVAAHRAGTASPAQTVTRSFAGWTWGSTGRKIVKTHVF
jgi:hypothetical protein